MSKQAVVGILAHVDAGKTTLAEAMLFNAGRIRKRGRVDDGDSHLDTNEIERERGITIFSSQAVLDHGGTHVMLVDAPGHVDFSAEAERTLRALDYAILVVGANDGVQGHTETLWRLLARYDIPTFIFINKIDLENPGRDVLLAQLGQRLSEGCLDANELLAGGTVQEDAAALDEAALEEFLEAGELSSATLSRMVAERKLFPCFAGSALKDQGVDELLDGICALMREQAWLPEFAARVYRVSRGDRGERLAWVKVTGGTLHAKQVIGGRSGAETWEQKVDQVRIYNGDKYELAQEVAAGGICAVTGLAHVRPGDALGAEPAGDAPVIAPVLTYTVLPGEHDVHTVFQALTELADEDPMLGVSWNTHLEQIHLQLMGAVQLEVVQRVLADRFGLSVSFESGGILYKETISQSVEGVGHFEPLRHYAEVHLSLEPLPAGSGVQFGTVASTDELDLNWQRLALTNAMERDHLGVLTGSPITDIRITLTGGRAHAKHTEGGDFRQATYRALRQGLMRAQNVLLEPVYSFRLEIPQEQIGRAMTDIQRMNGTFEPPQTEGEFAILCGSAPVACMRGYQQEVTSYSRGRGKLFCTLQGYAACHNAEEVMAAAGYDPEADLENPPSSVFCAHGAGFVVPWDQVEEYMHLEAVALPSEKGSADEKEASGIAQSSRAEYFVRERKETPETFVSEEELEEIFKRTYYQNSEPKSQKGYQKRCREEAPARRLMERSRAAEADRSKPRERYLLVDGYNIIFSWEMLRELSKVNIESARNLLMDVLCDYQGFNGCTLILVFDAYRVEGGQERVFNYHNIHVVFTKEAETADQYIEKTVHKIGKKADVTVATSDALEQVIIYGQGARRMAARELLEEVELTREKVLERIEKRPGSTQKQLTENDHNYLFDHLPEELVSYMEEVRLGKREL